MAVHTGAMKGRNGLLIPTFDIDLMADRDNQSAQILGFFRSLWHANGIIFRSKFEIDTNAPVFHELVVPPSDIKPLVVIRGQYCPATDYQRRRDKEQNIARNRWDDSGGFGRVNESVVTIGTEKHSVLLAPTKKLQWLELFSVSYESRNGQLSPYDRITPHLSMKNLAKAEEASRKTQYSKKQKHWGDAQQESNKVFNNYVSNVVKQFIEYIS